MAEPTYKRDAMKSATNVAGLAPEMLPLVWGGYIIRPTDEKFPSYHGFPNEPGIYAMYTSIGDLMYVGRSVAVATRLRQHAKSTNFMGGWPSLYSYRLVPESILAAVEIAHIKALMPPENIFMEASGSSLYEPMAEAVAAAWADALPAQRARLDAQYTALAEQIAARL